MVNGCLAFGGVPLAHVPAPLNVPVVVGVPSMTPMELMFNPGGKDPDTPKVIGGVPSAMQLKE